MIQKKHKQHEETDLRLNKGIVVNVTQTSTQNALQKLNETIFPDNKWQANWIKKLQNGEASSEN